MPEGTNPPAPAPATLPSVDDLVSSLTLRYGTPQAALQQLARENLKYRQRHRDTAAELEGYKTRNPANSVVLAGEELNTWQAVKAVLTKLGLKPADIEALHKERGELSAALTTDRKKSAIQEAATAENMNADILADLIETKGLVLEMKEATVEEDGNTVVRKLPHVRSATEQNGTFVRLSTYAETHLKPYLPALRKSADTDMGDGDNGESTAEFPTQRSATGQERNTGARNIRQIVDARAKSYMTPGEMKKAAQGNK